MEESGPAATRREDRRSLHLMEHSRSFLEIQTLRAAAPVPLRRQRTAASHSPPTTIPPLVTALRRKRPIRCAQANGCADSRAPEPTPVLSGLIVDSCPLP